MGVFKCFMCSSDSFDVLADNKIIRFGCYGYEKNVVKCKFCGLVQLFPIWIEEELKKLYSTYSQKKDFEGYKPKKNITAYLQKYIKKNDEILEIGCGFGDNVRNLAEKGYNAIGIDKDPTVADGKLIFNTSFEEFESKGKKFDFVYAIQVLEH